MNCNNSNHLVTHCDSINMKMKEPAIIEQAFDRLQKMVSENRILSCEIADNVFLNRPESNGQTTRPEPVVLTLPGMIDEISDRIIETNDLLVRVKDCLKEQLGEIKLG